MGNCLECSMIVKERNRFCSMSCSAKYNNKRRVKKLSKCYCGKTYSSKGKSSQKFCSVICGRNKIYDDFIFLWKQEKISGETKYGTSEHIRRYLFEKQEGKCVVCKKSKWLDQDIPLQLEHIDGNYRNNFEKNVCLMCPNCHSQTPTYGGKNKNKGFGRTHRKKSNHETLDLMRKVICK